MRFRTLSDALVFLPEGFEIKGRVNESQDIDRVFRHEIDQAIIVNDQLSDRFPVEFGDLPPPLW